MYQTGYKPGKVEKRDFSKIESDLLGAVWEMRYILKYAFKGGAKSNSAQT